MDIIFKCHSCEQTVTIYQVYAGSVVECPKCKARVLVPAESTPTTNPAKAEHQTVIVEKIQGLPLRVEVVGVRVSWRNAWNVTTKVLCCLLVLILVVVGIAATVAWILNWYRYR